MSEEHDHDHLLHLDGLERAMHRQWNIEAAYSDRAVAQGKEPFDPEMFTAYIEAQLGICADAYAQHVQDICDENPHWKDMDAETRRHVLTAVSLGVSAGIWIERERMAQEADR